MGMRPTECLSGLIYLSYFAQQIREQGGVLHTLWMRTSRSPKWRGFMIVFKNIDKFIVRSNSPTTNVFQNSEMMTAQHEKWEFHHQLQMSAKRRRHQSQYDTSSEDNNPTLNFLFQDPWNICLPNNLNRHETKPASFGWIRSLYVPLWSSLTQWVWPQVYTGCP